jgi:hypothetical protein
MARRPTPGWEQAPGWGLPAAADPLPLRAAGSLGRWLWPTTAIIGFLATVGYLLGHDDPRPGLSDRGWLALVLAAVLVVVLTVRRAAGPGPLARTLAEYAVVALLAVLLATAGARQQPAERAEDRAGRRPPTEQPTDRRQPGERADASPPVDRRPGLVRVASGVWGWLAELWHTAGELADRSTPPPSTTTPKEGS